MVEILAGFGSGNGTTIGALLASEISQEGGMHQIPMFTTVDGYLYLHKPY
jgi:hypothetical protein